MQKGDWNYEAIKREIISPDIRGYLIRALLNKYTQISARAGDANAFQPRRKSKSGCEMFNRPYIAMYKIRKRIYISDLIKRPIAARCVCNIADI